MNETLKFILMAVGFGLLATALIIAIMIAIMNYSSKRKKRKRK